MATIAGNELIQLDRELGGGDEPLHTMTTTKGRNITPLHRAAEQGHRKTVELLMELEGTDVNAQSRSGRTPLSLAAQNGHLPSMRQLLRGDADPLIADKEEQTPLMWAEKMGHCDCTALLIAGTPTTFPQPSSMRCRTLSTLSPDASLSLTGLPTVAMILPSISSEHHHDHDDGHRHHDSIHELSPPQEKPDDG